MSIKTNAYEDRVLNTMRGTALAAWTAYAALLTAVTDAEAGTVTEAAWTGASRVAITYGAPSPAGTVQNSGQVLFNQRTSAGTDTAVALGIYDASSSGELRYVITLAQSKSVGQNDTPSFAIGNITVNEA